MDLRHSTDKKVTFISSELKSFLSQGFERATWNLFEASHGKGAPDGVGGVLKQAADAFIIQGRDIPDAQSLFEAFQCATSVKL